MAKRQTHDKDKKRRTPLKTAIPDKSTSDVRCPSLGIKQNKECKICIVNENLF